MSETSNTKQAAWLAIGSLASFGFSIVSSMILSRYFVKSDYGTYKQVMYVYNTLLIIFLLGLPRAYSFFLPRVPLSQAKHLINKINRLFWGLGALFSIALFVFAQYIANVLNNPDLSDAIRIFSPVPFLMLPTQGLEGVLATYRKSGFMAIYTVITRLLMLLCVGLPVMIWNCGYKEALLGFVIASMVTFALAMYLMYYPIKCVTHEKSDIKYKSILKFALPLFFASIFGVIIQSSDQFFISRWFGSEVFADFSNGAMEIPFVGMIVSATTTVLSPIFSRMSFKKVDPRTEIYPLWKSVFEKSALLIYPLVVYCIFFAKTIMVSLYGPTYDSSAIYFQIKNITYFFSIIAFAPLLINTGRVKIYTNVQVWGAVILIVLEYLCVVFVKNPVGIIIISVSCAIGRILFMLSVIAKFFRVRFKDLFPIETMAKIIVSSVVILLAISHVLSFFTLNSWLVLFISSFVFAILFWLVSLVLNVDYIKIVKPFIHKEKA